MYQYVSWNLTHCILSINGDLAGTFFYLLNMWPPLSCKIHIIHIYRVIRRQKVCDESLWCTQQSVYLCTSHLCMLQNMQHTRNKITHKGNAPLWLKGFVYIFGPLFMQTLHSLLWFSTNFLNTFFNSISNFLSKAVNVILAK